MACGAQAQLNVLRLPLCHHGLPDGHPQKWAVCQEAGDVCEGVGDTWEEVGDMCQEVEDICQVMGRHLAL